MNKSKGKIIALHLTKGGVGKTTTLVNIGFCLRELGNKILFVDADPQYSLSEFFPLKKGNKSILNLVNGELFEPTFIAENVGIIEGSQELHTSTLPINRLSEMLDKYREFYDFILIDTSPALSNITLNAMNACDKIYLPVEASLMGLQAINKTYYALSDIGKDKVGGVFLTKYKKNTISSQESEKEINKNTKTKVFKTYIRDASQANNAHMLRKPVIEAYPTSMLAFEYRELTRELLETLK